MTEHCRKCQAEIITAVTKDGITLELDQNQVDGQVLVLDGRAAYLSGTVLREARTKGFPLYTRHGVACRNWWKKIDD